MSGLDDSQLAQFLGAFRANCLPSPVVEWNLLAEAHKRLEKLSKEKKYVSPSP